MGSWKRVIVKGKKITSWEFEILENKHSLKSPLVGHMVRGEYGSPPMHLGLEVVTYPDSLHFPLKWKVSPFNGQDQFAIDLG